MNERVDRLARTLPDKHAELTQELAAVKKSLKQQNGTKKIH
jgi:hypothetical protein